MIWWRATSSYFLSLMSEETSNCIDWNWRKLTVCENFEWWNKAKQWWSLCTLLPNGLHTSLIERSSRQQLQLAIEPPKSVGCWTSMNIANMTRKHQTTRHPQEPGLRHGSPSPTVECAGDRVLRADSCRPCCCNAARRTWWHNIAYESYEW